MLFAALAPVSSLAGSGRIGPLGRARRAGAAELAALAVLGALSALLTTLLDFKLRIPGHHIIYAVFPLALGLALVPRRLAGTIMSGTALGTVLALGAAGLRTPGIGVLTALVVVGPLLDRALRWGRSGLRLYGAFVAAGALANAAAFLLRGAAKYVGVGALAGTRPFGDWLAVAMWTYLLCGMLAGLISAAAWFQLRRSEPS